MAFNKLQEQLFPPEHPYHHPTIGSMEDLDAASLEDVAAFFRTYYAPNNAVLAIAGDADAAQARAWVERYFGQIPAKPHIPQLGDISVPLTLGGEQREVVEDRVPLARHYFGFRAPSFGDPRLDALEVAVADPCRRQGQPALSPPRPRRSRSPRTSPSSPSGSSRGASIAAGQATVRPGVDPARCRARLRGRARPARLASR